MSSSGCGVRASPPLLVHIEASYWLRQPEEFLHSRVAREWGLVDQSPPGAGVAPDRDSATRRADPDDTEVLPRVEPGVGDPPTQRLQTPAVPQTPPVHHDPRVAR